MMNFLFCEFHQFAVIDEAYMFLFVYIRNI